MATEDRRRNRERLRTNFYTLRVAKILPLLQSGAIFYSYPGFRYAPPWAKVYRHSVARSIAKASLNIHTGYTSDRLLDLRVRPVVFPESILDTSDLPYNAQGPFGTSSRSTNLQPHTSMPEYRDNRVSCSLSDPQNGSDDVLFPGVTRILESCDHAFKVH